MADRIDLHMHTNHSDGVSSSSEVLELVRKSRVVAFAVTDHDTLAGYREIQSMIKSSDPELVPGVELSVQVNDVDVHLLAYLFDPDHERLNQALIDFQSRRSQRGQQIIEKLNRLGAAVPFEAVQKKAIGSVIGRPHIAETMHSLKIVGSYQEAFDRYISKSGPAYVPKISLPPEAAMQLVHDAGGVVVLAHPFVDDAARHIDILLHMGLDGIEVYHSSHTPQETGRLIRIAERHQLLKSGGSDYHGREGRYGMIGALGVPAQYLAALKNKALTYGA